MQEAYDIIKRASDLLAQIPKRGIKEATEKDYRAKFNRFVTKRVDDNSYASLFAEALKTTKKSTWQANRAALIFTFAGGLRDCLQQQENVQRGIKAAIAAGETPNQSDWLKMVNQIKSLNVGLKELLAAKLPIEGREDRHTKRQDMRGLPEDWRERIIARMPKYRDQALVAAVTGCRPAELVSGVELAIDEKNGDLVGLIKGAKISEKAGQEWRRMRWPANSESVLVRSLVGLIGKHAAGTKVRVAVDDAKIFSGAMRAAGKREWPKRKSTVTPYCMRHQAAADMKATGTLSSGDISAALGHVSDVTKSTYGHANMGRKSGGVAPTLVEAARPVLIKSPSPAARQLTRQAHREVSEIEIPSESLSPEI